MQDYLNIDDIEVGIDEAGLGCVAGSFFVSAVILPKKCPNPEHLKLWNNICLLYTSPSPRDLSTSRMPSSA